MKENIAFMIGTAKYIIKYKQFKDMDKNIYKLNIYRYRNEKSIYYNSITTKNLNQIFLIKNINYILCKYHIDIANNTLIFNDINNVNAFLDYLYSILIKIKLLDKKFIYNENMEIICV